MVSKNSIHRKSPVLLMTYRKFEFIEEILNIIQEYQPSKLYLSRNQPKDASEEKSYQKITEIIDSFKFNFEVELILHKTYLPISKSVVTSINKAFEKEDQLIILEDDIIPNQSFFKFCDLMLDKYRYSNEIGCINGCNLNAINSPNGYFLSSMGTPFWGWATWKNRWDKYRSDNYYWDNYQERIVSTITYSYQAFFKKTFDNNSKGTNVWDIQWNLSLMSNQYKITVPTINLTTNRGFLQNAVTTNYISSNFSNLECYEFSSLDLQQVNNIKFKERFEEKVMELFKEISHNLSGNGNHILNT